MFRPLLQFMLNSVGWFILFLLFTFPYISYKIFLTSPIMPSIDIIIIYYLICYRKLGNIPVVIISIIIDQLTSMPLGCNMLAYVTANMVLKFVGRYLTIWEIMSNFIVFCSYCLAVFIVRYLIFISLKYYPSLLEIMFQYMVTILSYPSLRLIIHKTLVMSKLET